MGRRSGFVGFLNAVARDTTRAARQAEAARKRHERELAKSIRDAQRATAQLQRERAKADKDAKQLYLQEQIEDAAEQTAELAEPMVELRSVLDQTLAVDDRIDFDTLRASESFPAFDAPKEVRSAHVAFRKKPIFSVRCRRRPASRSSYQGPPENTSRQFNPPERHLRAHWSITGFEIREMHGFEQVWAVECCACGPQRTTDVVTAARKLG